MASNVAPLTMSLARAQGLVGLQIVLSVPLQIAFVWLGPHVVHWSLPGETLAERLAFALRWQMVGLVPLLAMILLIAGARVLWSETIGGDPQARQLELHVRVQRNTLEQMMLMLVSHLALATLLPREELGLLPTLATLFVVARIAYWVGYVRNPMLRTFGFVATFYPNIYAVVLALWYAFVR
jgi:uncharacterized membrane protein YecN with MAPEG domain